MEWGGVEQWWKGFEDAAAVDDDGVFECRRFFRQLACLMCTLNGLTRLKDHSE